MNEDAKPTGAVLISKDRDISAFCSDDETRYVLNGVFYDSKNQRLIATNGRIAIMVPVTVSEDHPDYKATDVMPKDCIIPTEQFQEGLKLIRESKLPVLETLRLETTEDDKAKLSTNNLDRTISILQTTRTIEGNFPPVDQVIPKGEPKYSIGFHHQTLSKLVAFLEQAGEKAFVRLDFYGGTDAAKFTIPLKDGTESVGAIMPWRLADYPQDKDKTQATP